MMPGTIRGNDSRACDRVVEARSSATLRNLGFLEVCHQFAAARIDTEEVVDVGGGGLRLSAALGNERDGAGDAARTSASANTGACALEPQLDGERRATQLAGGAQGRVLTR